jgi:GMP synthase PP-ATPase subunit
MDLETEVEILEMEISKVVGDKIRAYNLDWDTITVIVYKNLKTVGVQGDERTYKCPVEIGVSKLGKTVWNFDFLADLSTEITNKFKEINRVIYSL